MFDPRYLKLSFLFIIFNGLNYINFYEAVGVYKYEIIVDYLDFPETKRDKLYDFGTVRVKKLDRTTYGLDGYFDVLQDVTDDMEATYEIYTLQGNEYRRTTDKQYKKQLCSLSKQQRSYFLYYFKFTDIPPDYDCPFPKGRYHIINASFSNEILPMEPPRGEKFRLNITVNLGAEELSRFSIYAILKKKMPWS